MSYHIKARDVFTGEVVSIKVIPGGTIRTRNFDGDGDSMSSLSTYLLDGVPLRFTNGLLEGGGMAFKIID